MNLVFRQIEETSQRDIKQFNELMDELTSHAQNQELLIQNIKRANESKTTFLMVAEDVEHKQLCGSLLAVLQDDYCEECRPFMLIENVVTHPDYRKRGVGKKMFEQIEKWGRQWNVSYAILCSGLNRVGAHKFYQSVGYDEIKGYRKYLKNK